MSAIRKSEAVEKLAQAASAASCDDLADVFAELFPDKPRLRLPDAEQRRSEIIEYIRTKMEPEEMVDLWNVVFPAHRNVYYDDADGLLCYTQEESGYAKR
jgi:hypothetical protein